MPRYFFNVVHPHTDGAELPDIYVAQQPHSKPGFFRQEHAIPGKPFELPLGHIARAPVRDEAVPYIVRKRI